MALVLANTPSAVVADVLGGVLGSTLGREPLVTPASLGASSIDGLQTPDPAAGIDLIAPPTVNNNGTATMTQPLSIPAGRGGFQPDLAATYDSSAGSSWLGTGWDLSYGTVEVDTSYGVPRYLPDKESETYTLDGAQLAPTAVRTTLQDRVAERHDFAPRVDTGYEHIVRHGDSPKNYWWEVTDKMGGKRWYGGVPDCAGPDGWEDGRTEIQFATDPAQTDPIAALQRDPSAILADANGNAFRWGLSAQRDVGGNLIRYFYDTVTTHPWGPDGPSAKQMYIRKIQYTGWAAGHCTVVPGKLELGTTAPLYQKPAEDPAYEIDFLRDSDITPTPLPRKDVIVDATGGFVQATSDLLRRIDIFHGAPTDTDPANVFRAGRTQYNELVKSYSFNYDVDAPFGKSLLTSIDQLDTHRAVFATNRFDYFNDVRPNGVYNGFVKQTTDTNSGNDNLGKNLLGPVGTSVLGSSESTEGDFHLYLGFNPLDPLKDGSFGGEVTIKAGGTDANTEFLDLNGDGLPDKVFRSGGVVKYRLNTTRPGDATGSFEPVAHNVKNLSKLSSEFNVGVEGGVMAQLGVGVQFGIAGEVTVGEDYFTDVNNDGLADFISGGEVYFNHLERDASTSLLVPTFSTDSSLTSVPVDDGTATVGSGKALADAEAQQRAMSPLQDTVRRWIAPFAGTVSITGDVTLDPQPDPNSATKPYSGDGVTVAIQRAGSELWRAALVTPGASVTPGGVGAVTVERGQAIYFRLQSIDSGVRDQVRWNPQITYTAYTAGSAAGVDANGLSQSTFTAADDFTLAGRPGTTITMPLDGVVHFDATVNKSRATTDDVTVLVLKNGTPVISQVIPAATVSSAIPVSGDITVAAPVTSGTTVTSDKLEVKLAIDSPIDIQALSWTPRIYYTSATSGGQPVPTTDPRTGQNTLELAVPANIDIYPSNTLTAPAVPWTSALGRAVTAVAHISGLGLHAGGSVTVTVKQQGTLIAKSAPFPVAAGVLTALDVPVDVTLVNGQSYFFDVTIHDNVCTADGCKQLSERIDASSIQLQWNDGGAKTENVPSTRNWSGPQGIFPVAYRGWGYAGYNGDGDRAAAPITESDFVINPSDYPTSNPTDVNDPSYAKAQNPNSSPFTPFVLELHDADGKAIGTEPVWRGAKDNIEGGAGFARSSRRGVDDPSAISNGGGVGGTGTRAVRNVGIAAPTVSISAGAFGIGASFSAGPSFGLQSYTDMNGDGFPDIVTPGNIDYTGPRGGYTHNETGPDVVNQDVTFAVGVGFSGSPLEVSASSTGDANTAQNTASSSTHASATGTGSAAAGGREASAEEFGASISLTPSFAASFTNPVTTPAGTPPKNTTAPLELELADVNGDGLPDRIIGTPQGVKVQYNLGYSFTPEAAPLAGGAFEAGESYTGALELGIGFNIENKEFAGGLSYNETDTIPRYAWIDVDGDGVLDRLFRNGNTIEVSFGTGTGLLPAVKYGDVQDGNINIAGNDVPIGQQIAQDRSVGLGAGVDFTIGIGPLCLVACYLIVNPGIHFDHTISNSNVQLQDVDGDGYPDSVRSDSDNRLAVFHNNRGKTNLLKTARTALGGSIAIDYKRDGNTVDQPNSTWTMSSVLVSDGHPGVGEGAHTMLSTFEYSGSKYDRLERQSMGYDTVTERQRTLTTNGSLDTQPIARSIVHTFSNHTIFDAGLETSQTLLSPTGLPVERSVTHWRIVDLRSGFDADTGASAAGLDGVNRLQLAVGQLQSSIDQQWFADDGTTVGESNTNTYRYMDPVTPAPLPLIVVDPSTLPAVPWRDLSRGNVIHQEDLGQSETAADNLYADITYTDCRTRQGDALANTLDYTWVSVPSTLKVSDASGKVLRSADATKHTHFDFDGSGTIDEDDDPGTLCDNQSITRLDESIDGDILTPASSAARDSADCHEITVGPKCATTELSYDDWGSYADIVYPANANGERLRVNYVYSNDSHANVADTTDSHGLRSTASFSCVTPANVADYINCTTDQITSRTDENGQLTTYTYDSVGRIASITMPKEQGSGHATVTFEYHPEAPYPYAVAHHFDVLHPSDPIDKVAFVDGLGRTTQTQQDASIFTGATTPAAARLVISGPIGFDGLGRVVSQRYPFTAAPTALGTFQSPNLATAVAPTLTEWNVRDLATKVTAPNGSITRTAYDFGGSPDLGASYFTRTETDPLGKANRVFTDSRNNVMASDEVPVGAPVLRTKYRYDPLGQLIGVTDSGANQSTFTYDMLGRRTSANTPDAGLVETRYDAAGNITSRVTPNLRAAGQQISYSYDFERLLGIQYPDGTPNVSYRYGGTGDTAVNGAGRVIGVVDGVRNQSLAYDQGGQVASETSTMLVHNISTNTDDRLTFNTTFRYDSFGRTLGMTYPDGEELSYNYDSGGLLASINGAKAGQAYRYLDSRQYDEFFDRRFQQVGNGTQSTYSYDAQTRNLTRLLTNAPARNVQDLNYSYDLASNVTKSDNRTPMPAPGLMGGPSTQNYTYDPYYRVKSATGTYSFAPNKTETYSYALAYDINGNITSKAQTDMIGKIVQMKTTYTLAPTYSASKPHQISRIGTRPYTFDANGNFTGWTDTSTGQNRTATWDAENRMTSVADQGSTTSFKYGQAGDRGISRGPGGEMAFVNSWYTVENGTVAWKDVWADGDRLMTQRVFTDGTREFMRYFLHKDLQGSTNIVTDDTGLVYEHLEYFPSGEIWVEEHKDVHRTPYLYTGGYFDVWRNLINMGDRWYEPREQFMYSPDPVLQSDPNSLISDSALSSAYSYAESNPISLVDNTGRTPGAARQAFTSALRSGGNRFNQWSKIKPNTPASRKYAGGWGARLAGVAPRTTDPLRTLGERIWKKDSEGNTDLGFDIPPLVKLDFKKSASGWKLDKAEVVGKTAFERKKAAAPTTSPTLGNAPPIPAKPAGGLPPRPTRQAGRTPPPLPPRHKGTTAP